MTTETDSYIERCNRQDHTDNGVLVLHTGGKNTSGSMVLTWLEQYNLFLRHSLHNCPTTVAVNFSQRNTIAPLEAALIGVYLPSTKNLETTFGLRSRSNLEKLL